MMMKKAFILLVVLGIMTVFILPLFSADAQYVGSKKCMMCHKSEARGNQYGKWLAGPHAKALETLKSAESAAIAKKMGIADPSASDKCIKCHVTGHAAPAAAKAEGFDQTEGVGCEACHGPGSLYKSMSVMKALYEGKQNPREVAFEKGSKENCLTCHNQESPTFKPFDFAARWKEIEHTLPEK